ncbi:Solute-binding protein [bioreactor metagenome]|uniref:Solute-binding protein n=1 Tax=bioreactor metagenome TaxID=1076179 RepID=A0A645ALF5_9ZZZZ
MFNDINIARDACDGDLGESVIQDLPKVKLKSIVYGENGFRNVTNNKGSIKTPADLKGIKIRTMENAIHMKAFQLLGASPTPMNFNELYTALQQGTVDAQENPIFLIYTSKFYEVQKYLTLTGHLYAPGIITMGNSYWESLPEDIQSIVVEGGKQFRDMQRGILDQQNVDYLQKLKDEGMQVNELTAEEKAAFVEATKPIYDDVAKTIGQDLVDLAIAANQKYAK